MATKIIFKNSITCPNCEFQKAEKMPVDACQYFYQCESCNLVLKPKKGDCCVFCSYGSVDCPPVQKSNAGSADSCC